MGIGRGGRWREIGPGLAGWDADKRLGIIEYGKLKAMWVSYIGPVVRERNVVQRREF
jgi:hypothetical protein